MEVSKAFTEIYDLIAQARERAFRAVNKELIELYWRVGEYISFRVEKEEWGKGVVDSLASYLKDKEPDLRGFSARNLENEAVFRGVHGFPKTVNTVDRNSVVVTPAYSL